MQFSSKETLSVVPIIVRPTLRARSLSRWWWCH